MIEKSKLTCFAVALFAAGVAFGQSASIPYGTDFEEGAGSEWSTSTYDSLRGLGTFLGPFGDGTGRRGRNRAESTTLSVETTAGVEYAVIFDLFIFDHWEGTRRHDSFSVSVGHKSVFSHEFSYSYDNETFDQDTMWLDRYENIGYDRRTDLILRDVTVRFLATGGTEEIKFAAKLRRDGNDESWGLDRVRVVPADDLEVSEAPISVEWVGNLRESRSVERVSFASPAFETRERQIAWLPTRGKIHPDLSSDRIAWRSFAGLVLPEAGKWSFRLTSDDGSTLRIDGELIINNDGRHAPRARSASRELSVGTHLIDVRGFEWGGAAALVLEWKGPKSHKWSVVPPSAFVYAPSQDIPFTNVTAQTRLDRAPARIAMSQGWNDLNNDGYLDLMIGGYYGNIRLGGSDGKFRSAQDRMLLYYQTAMSDIDNDGDIDIMSGYRGVYVNDGSGRFSMQRFPGLGISYSISASLPDLDADGRSDLAGTFGYSPIFARNSPTDGISINFDQSELSSLMSLFPRRLRYGTFLDADLNNDGWTDLVRAGGYEGVLVALRTQDQYTLERITVPVQRVNFVFSSCSAGDFDNDGDLDLFNGTHYYGRGNGVLVNNGPASFSPDNSIVPDCATMRWNGAEFGDVDNDGDLDMLLRSFYTSRVLLRLNDGTGKFTWSQSVGVTPRYPTDARFVDYDNDGDLDICVVGYYGLALIRNDTDDNAFLKVRVRGAGDGRTNAAGVGTRVELLDAQTRAFIARRDITSTSGMGSGPFWLHFGGVDPSGSYIVRTHFLSGAVDRLVVPTEESSVIGNTNIAQMVTIEESSDAGRRVTRWRETNQRETIRAALRAEAMRRGLRDQILSLRQAGHLTIPNLLNLLGARTIREALGDNAAVLVDLTRDPRRNP